MKMLGTATTEKSPSAAGYHKRQRGQRFQLVMLAIVAGLGISPNAVAKLESGASGSIFWGFSGCLPVCPEFCDRSTNTACADSSGMLFDANGTPIGPVISRACSRYGVLEARAMIRPETNSQAHLNANAKFYEHVTLHGATGRAIARVTFRVTGTRTGSTHASGGFTLDDSDLSVNEVPLNSLVTLSNLVEFEDPFLIGANLIVQAPPAVGNCGGVAAGLVYDVNYSISVAGFEVLSTNGVPLPTVCITGESGTRYDCPSITLQPQSQSACVGASALFSVEAPSSCPFTYQWRKNGMPIPGQTNSTLSLSSVSTNDAGSYSVVVSGGLCSVISAEAQLTPLLPFSISVQPSRAGVCGSGSFTLAASVTGSSPVSFQWRSNGVVLAGATNNSYNGFFSGGATESYDVIATNSCGSVTSAVASVSRATALPPLSEPASQAVCLNEQFDFCLCHFVFNRTNGGPVTFQWRKNGTNIPGARSFFYGKTHASTNDAGVYSCLVSNACGSVSSPDATLTVLPMSVSVVALDAVASEEGNNPGAFTITRSQSACGSLRVFYELTGRASNGVDYAMLPKSVVIPAGTLSLTLPVLPMDDFWLETTEAVVLTLLPNTNYSIIATSQSAIVTIAENDVLSLVVSTNFLRVPEGGEASFTVQLNGPPPDRVTVDLAHIGGDNDLRITGDRDHVFRDNNWNVPRVFTLTANNDGDSSDSVATFMASGTGVSNVIVTVVEIDRTAPPTIASIVCLTNDLRELRILGYPGSNYIVETTPRLSQPSATIPWARLGTTAADPNGLARFTVPETENSPQGFFRARNP